MKAVSGIDHSSIVRALKISPSSPAAFVDVFYHAVLGRAPDEKGLAAYVDVIAKSPDRESLIAVLRSIAMSDEAREFREHHIARR